MRLIRNGMLKIAIIDKSKKKILLNPAKVPKSIIQERINKAMDEQDEIRWYYLPKTDFEVIKTAMPPYYEQTWHSHSKLREAVLVLKGQVIVLEENKSKQIKRVLDENDFLLFDKGIKIFHTMRNPSKDYVYTLSYKFRGSNKKNTLLFKTDWHPKKGFTGQIN